MKTAVAGCGAIAPIHIEGLLNRGIKIAALCDIKRERAEALKEKYSLNAAIYTDFVQMLDNEELQAVHICTPHYLHAQQSVDALNRNISVLCEKPMALSREQILEIQDAAKNSKGVYGVCFQNRFLASNIAAKEFCNNKEGIQGYFAVPWYRDNDYYSQSGWRGKWATEGGGVLTNQAIHTLDLMLWFMGKLEKAESSYRNFNHKNIIEVEDTAVCNFNFKDGGRALFFATTAAPDTFPVQIRLYAGKDCCVIENNDVYINGQLFDSGGQYSGAGKACWGDGHKLLIKEFYDCIEQGRKFCIDGLEAAKVSEMLFKIYDGE